MAAPTTDGYLPIQPGPSGPVSNGSASGVQEKSKRKRKSTDNGDQQRKKKTNRACFHCQKAHLTCDDARPCQRCIKRGLADNCTEGVRKRAKYLLDDDELEQMKRDQNKERSDARRGSTSTPSNASTSSYGPIVANPPPVPQQSTYSVPVSGQPPISPSYPSQPYIPPSYPQDGAYTFSNFTSNSGQPELNPDSFGSEALNMEYSILSHILAGSPDGNNWADNSSPTVSQSPFLTYGYPPQQAQFVGGSSNQGEAHPLTPRSPLSHRPRSPPLVTPTPQGPPPVSWASVPPSQSEQALPSPSVAANRQVHPLAPRYPDTRARSPPYNPAWPSSPTQASNDPSSSSNMSLNQNMSNPTNYSGYNPPSQFNAPPSASLPSGPSASSSSFPMVAAVRAEFPQSDPYMAAQIAAATNTSGVPGVGLSVPATGELRRIMETVTTPYDYTQGYHFLMRFLVEHFEKNDILRIVRALAIFRPSLIALQMPLSIDDEIFIEQCFQRSLLELKKLIALSGTPTVVWRRTGEICLVGHEFTHLTGWTVDQLVPRPDNENNLDKGKRKAIPSRRKYIYELFDPQSTVEYWESFAQHAFENSTHSVYSHCVLLKPDGAPVPCTFCFSVRRDMFDLPSLIVGQWLPLL